MSRIMIGLFSMFGLGPETPPSTDIISNVIINEHIYKNRETIYGFDYEFQYMKREEPGVIRSWVGERRFVAQGAKRYYSSTDRIPAKEGGTKFIGLNYRFDGDTSRINLQDQVVNIQKGTDLSSGIWTHPHTLILEMQGLFRSSLSEYLIQAFRPRPDPGTEAWRGKVEGYDSVAGVESIRLRFDLLGTDMREPLRATRILWLAVDRNYIPVRNEVYRGSSFGKVHATTVSTVDEWKEAAPGIWVPFSATEQTWDAPALFEDGKEIVANTAKHRLIKFDLNPNYDDAFFQQLDIRKGMPVHELDGNGTIIRTTIEGGLPPTPSRGRSWFSAVLAALVLLLVVAGGFLIWRARRRTYMHSNV